ncbi:MAG: SDR family oxidoreductase [Pseudomonadota bacterium]|jgi:short-subunit dehydrogenase
MQKRFDGQIVLVTGGTGGLGQAVSLAFLAEGATVLVTYRGPAEFAALQTAAGEDQSRLEGHVVDVLDEGAMTAFITDVVARHGRMDSVVNAVGGYAAGAAPWEMPPDALDKMLTLNVRAGYRVLRSVVPVMLRQGQGAIVNVAAVAAIAHIASAAEYVASKAAAVAMIDSAAANLKGTGVRANSILPSLINTAPNRAAMPKANHAAWPQPEDIARVILFLCSQDAHLVNGAAIAV